MPKKFRPQAFGVEESEDTAEASFTSVLLLAGFVTGVRMSFLRIVVIAPLFLLKRCHLNLHNF